MEGQSQKLMTKLNYSHPHFYLKNDEKIFFFKLQSVMDEQGQMRDKDGLYASAIYMVEHK